MMVLITVTASLIYFIIGMIFTNWIRSKLDQEMPILVKLLCALLFPIAYIIYVSVEFFSRDKQY